MSFIANISRLLLLIMAVILLLIVALWVTRPAVLSELSDRVLRYYENYHSKQLAIIDQKNWQADEKVHYLESLLEKWQAVAKRDRAGKYKTRAYELIVDEYRHMGNYLKAQQWIEQWIAFDALDLHAYANQARVLYQQNSTREKGLQQISQLYERFPRHGYINSSYIDILKFEQDFSRAIAVVDNSVDFRHDWKVYGDLGNGFNEKDSLGALSLQKQKQGRWGITFPQVDELYTIRIDLPSYQRLAISQIRFDVKTAEGIKSFYPAESELIVENMSVNSQGLLSQGHIDPYFYWHIPTEIKGRSMAISYSAVITPLYPDWVIEWLTNTDSGDIRRSLEQAGVADVDEILKYRQAFNMKG